MWPEDNNQVCSIGELIAAVSQGLHGVVHWQMLFIVQVQEPAEEENKMPIDEPQQPTRKEIMAATQLLLAISVDRRNEQEFSQLYRSISQVNCILQREAHEETRPTLITNFFKSTNTRSSLENIMDVEENASILSDSAPEQLASHDSV